MRDEKDKMTIAEFLKSGENCCSIDGMVYMKGLPQAMDSVLPDGVRKETAVIPVYGGHWAVRKGTPAPMYMSGSTAGMLDMTPPRLDFMLFWIPERSSVLICGNTVIPEPHGLDVQYSHDIKGEIEKYFSEGIRRWIDEELGKVEPAETPDQNTVRTMFDNGYTDIDIRHEMINMCGWYSKPGNPNTLKWVLGDTSDEDKRLGSIFKDFTARASKFKADRMELIRLVGASMDRDTLENRMRRVRTALVGLRNKSVYSCRATFDFGYCTVTRSIKTTPSNAWIGGSQDATRRFLNEFRQPVTMGFTAGSTFLMAYITKIESRKKSVYEATPLENRAENELYNAVFRSGTIDFDRNAFEGKNPDCSTPMPDGTDLLMTYVKGYYSTAEGVDFLIRHGADPACLIKNAEKLSQTLGFHGVSRDWNGIRQYLDNMYGEKPVAGREAGCGN